MSILATSLRPFWARGLNEISGNVAKDVAGWLAEGNYQIYLPLKSKEFTISFVDHEPCLEALAADINRMAVAAYESVRQATRSELFPKSSAWILIKSYYAAFFSAHALLRMLGKGFSNLEGAQTSCLNRIAKVYGTWVADVEPGNFVFSFRPEPGELSWHRVDASSGGVHEKFWSYFKKCMDELTKDVLKNKTNPVADNQQVGIKLGELVENLCFESSSKGTWLSAVRNRVNYRHQFGTWYPYKERALYGAPEERLMRHWSSDPMKINLTGHGDQKLIRFLETCNFMVGWCRVLSIDMSERCSRGRSFHTYGWLAISRLVARK